MRKEQMRQEDILWCKRHIPKEVVHMMEELGPKVCIGGGFIRSCITGDSINDIDLFVDSNETKNKVAVLLQGERVVKTKKTKNALTIMAKPYPIQVITRWMYPHPKEVLGSFDFTIACAVLWCNPKVGSPHEWCGLVHPDYYQDLAARRLSYTYPQRNEDAGGSALRVLKYYRKGYNITLNSYAGVISRLIGGIHWNEVIESNEKYRAGVLTGLLVQVDPSAVLGQEIVREEGRENDTQEA
jgi:hypothetical protein